MVDWTDHNWAYEIHPCVTCERDTQWRVYGSGERHCTECHAVFPCKGPCSHLDCADARPRPPRIPMRVVEDEYADGRTMRYVGDDTWVARDGFSVRIEPSVPLPGGGRLLLSCQQPVVTSVQGDAASYVGSIRWLRSDVTMAKLLRTGVCRTEDDALAEALHNEYLEWRNTRSRLRGANLSTR